MTIQRHYPLDKKIQQLWSSFSRTYLMRCYFFNDSLIFSYIRTWTIEEI